MWLFGLVLCVFPQVTHAQPKESPVIIIGVTGLMWPYIAETEHLSEFAEAGGIGSMSVKTVGPVTCPVAGWLTLGSGERAASCDEPTFTDDEVDQWDGYVQQSRRSVYSAQLGRLGDADIDIAAIGPRARLAAARDGNVPPESSIREAEGADLLLIDLGSIGPEEANVGGSAVKGGDPFSSFFTVPVRDTERITSEVAELDQRFGDTLATINDTFDDPEIYVVSVGDYSASTTSLQVIMSSEPGGLTSLTTRTDGLVHITDLYATLAERFSLSTRGIEGRAISAGTSETIDDMVRLDQQVQSVRPAVGPVMGLWALIWFATLAMWAAGKRHQLPLLALGAVPAAIIIANIFPWYLVPQSTFVLIPIVLTLALLIGYACWRTKAGVLGVSLTNLAVITAGMFVPHLTLYTVIGSLPHTGRFYGMNNMLFAIFAVNAVVAAWAAWRRLPSRQALWFVAGLGVAVILVDGWPGLGTDFGGPPVLVLGFGLILLAMASAMRWATVAMLLVPALVVPLAFMVIDYLRPHPTHVGTFFGAILDGRALPVITRKADQILVQWPYMIAFVILVGLVIAAWKKWGKPIRLTEAGVGAWCVVAALVILGGGSLINDSGIAIIAMGCAAGLPLALSRPAEVRAR